MARVRAKFDQYPRDRRRRGRCLGGRASSTVLEHLSRAAVFARPGATCLQAFFFFVVEHAVYRAGTLLTKALAKKKTPVPGKPLRV